MKEYGKPIFGTVTDDSPVVQTVNGKILGETRDGVASFRGIPYGGNCDGENRFMPPTPAEAWKGVRDCTKNGPIAMQSATSIASSWDFGEYFSGGHPELFGAYEESKSENCLVLNVLTPGLDDQKRAVLVYFHGGGFATGSGTTVLGADKMVREQDIVLIGVNHRLNVFGALHLGAFDEHYAQSGMCGMLDCVQALEWVRDNITAFGGDPDKVTIMGESGGGTKVNTLLNMPKAKGLFRAAIVESGSAIEPGALSIEEATETAEHFLYSLGIGTDELWKLTRLPAHHILDAAISLGMRNFNVVADGINITYNAEGVYPVCDPSLPLLVGASEDEMAAFASEAEYKATWDNLKSFLTKPVWSAKMFGPSMTDEQAEKVIEVFKQYDTKNNSADHLLMKIRSLIGGMGGSAFKQAMYRAQMYDGPVYNYLVAYDAPHRIIPGKYYSWHTADLPLQFRIVLHPEMEELSQLMSNAWGAFIRTGNPSTEKLEWPAFTETERKVMVFDDVTRVEKDPTAPYRNLFSDENN